METVMKLDKFKHRLTEDFKRKVDHKMSSALYVFFFQGEDQMFLDFTRLCSYHRSVMHLCPCIYVCVCTKYIYIFIHTPLENLPQLEIFNYLGGIFCSSPCHPAER